MQSDVPDVQAHIRELRGLVSDAPPRHLGYETDCLSCDDRIEADERAFVEHGIGAWHAECRTPLNLPLYRRERERGAFKCTRRKPRRQPPR